MSRQQIDWQREKAGKFMAMYVEKLEAGNCWPSADECGTAAQAFYAVDLLTDDELREWSRRIHAAEAAKTRKAS